MANLSNMPQLKQAETDIAVLQVQVKTLDEKIDDIKVDLKDIRDSLDESNVNTQEMIREVQKSNIEAHSSMANKISQLERWRWMMMGAGVVIGALGFETLSKLLK